VLQPLKEQLQRAESLSLDQVITAVDALISEDVSPEVKAEFLTALAVKGETPTEIAAFAVRLRDMSIRPPLSDEAFPAGILDVCGTGGDGLNTFNISTTVAILTAAAGATVAKHGNRAITSKSGSADVLEALGIRTELTPEEAVHWLEQYGFAFLFAPKYHPAFRHLAPARKLCAAAGQRTIFNFLGPLLNPAQATLQLVGVPRPDLCQPLVEVLQRMGGRRAMVVSGSVPSAGKFLDELSTLGENTIAEFTHARGHSISTLDPNHFPLQPAGLADLGGGDRDANAKIIQDLLGGIDRGPKRDAVLLNAAAALTVAELAPSLTEGWELAAAVIDDGRAKRKLEELVQASA